MIAIGLVLFNNNFFNRFQLSQNLEKCGIENCHGLEISCGANIPEACTMIYMPGDNCRQFAACEVIAGKCQLVVTDEFEACKTCVQQCEQNFLDDQMEFFQCESKCAV